nr:hypothetical protein [Angustibacter aerolatus]
MAQESTNSDPMAAFGPNEWLVDEALPAVPRGQDQGRPGLVGFLRRLLPRRRR